MNDDQRHDDAVLDQIDRLLEQGSPHDDALVNRLAQTLPKADSIFQQALEQRLMTRLQAQEETKEKHSMQMPMLARSTRPVSIAPLTWAVTLATVAIALIGFILVSLNRVPMPLAMATPSAAMQIEPTVSLVIATQPIDAGSVITDAMIGVVTLSVADMEKLRFSQPDHTFVAEAQAVIGQTAAVAIGWSQPIETILLGEPVAICGTPGGVCPEVPEDYLTSGLPLQADTLQGLKIGDRVDVLAFLDGQLRVVAANILLADIAPGTVTFATPPWQLGILIWLSQSGDSYALRLHTGEAPAALDDSPVEVTLTAPEPLPQDYAFDLIVSLPAQQGYLLADLPASIDAIPFTSNGDRLYFRFKNLEVVSIADGTQITIRLPQPDAANLDYLIGVQADVSYVPKE